MDISNIPLTSKKELAKAFILRKKVKEQKRLEDFKPWEPDQANAFRSKARTRIILGGNRSGKTEIGAVDVAHMFMGTHPYRENRIPMIIKVIAQTYPNHIHNIIQPKLFKLIPQSAIKSQKKNSDGVVVHIEGYNGSVIDFLAYSQEGMTFEGFDADMAWFDEPPPENVYKGVRRGLVDRQGTILFTMTPLSEPWFYQRIFMPAVQGELRSTEVFFLYTSNNPHIDKDEIEDFKKNYTEEELKSRLYGNFLHLSGIIYPFEQKIHKIKYFDWPREWPVWMSIDPHPMKAHAVTWIGVTNKEQKIIIDELKLAAPIIDLAKEIKKIEGNKKYRVVDRLIDTSIKGLERVDQRVILAEAGLRCRYAKKYDDVMPGIQRVQQLMRVREDLEKQKYAELVVRDNCKGHIKEFMSYVWDDNGRPRKEDDDYMDNVRYITGVYPRHHYHPKPVSYIGGLETYGGR
jgi:phage terminase large subunit-like protein